jgi:hypothetical protein
MRGGARCLTHDLWDELSNQIRLYLSSVSLGDVCEKRVLGTSGLAQRETYQAAENARKSSFPLAKGGRREEFRPYAKDSLLSAREIDSTPLDDDSDDSFGAPVAADSEDDLGEVVPGGRERPDQRGVRLPVAPAQARRGGLHRAMQDRRAAAVKRMRRLHLGLDHLESVGRQRQCAQKRRADGQRVDGRADVVAVSGQGQLGGGGTAADMLRALAHQHRAAGAGQLDGGRQAVRARADDDRVGQPVSRPAGTAGR